MPPARALASHLPDAPAEIAAYGDMVPAVGETYGWADSSVSSSVVGTDVQQPVDINWLQDEALGDHDEAASGDHDEAASGDHDEAASGEGASGNAIAQPRSLQGWTVAMKRFGTRRWGSDSGEQPAAYADLATLGIVDPLQPPGYHWRGLFWQSLKFNIIENVFRLASDDTMRYQIAHKPFWHDYDASIKQFNMRRWNDGDDFLVNYVGHPMQGSVAAFIAIQNSAVQSRIQWNEPGYWRSRSLAFLWSTVYSMHSEISPFGEAGIGTEGGFTYGTQCMEHCDASNFKPGDHYTNNTGWVDFIITPTVGMLWVFAEDWIDKDISPWLINGDQHPNGLKVLRGSLNPSRTFANLLRGRLPWYRDFQEDIPATPAYGGLGQHFLPSDETVAWRRSLPRFQISPHLTGLSILTTTTSCLYCRNMTTGAGLQFSARLLPFLDFDSDLSYQPGASPEASDRAGGDLLRGVYGIRVGYETPNYAVHLAVRPGFVRWDRAFTTSPTTLVLMNNQLGPNRYSDAGTVVVNPPPKIGPITHFEWNANLTGDYKMGDRFALRAGIGEDLVRYRTNVVAAPGIGEPPYLSWLSRENFINRGSWSYQFGPVFSF